MVNVFEIEAGLRSASEKERWAAAGAAGDLVTSRPRVVWSLVVAHGASPIEDVRAAVATCMLEHLLEEHFDEYFPPLEHEIRSGNFLLGDTLRRCWKMGQSELPENSARWDELVKFARESLAGRT
jgi:hypothetical protein